MSKSVLILIAHPDDTEFMAGGLVSKFVKQGYDVYQLVATNGGRGSFELESENLIKIREKETKEAARIIGIKDVIFLGFPDGFLGDTPIKELRKKFVRAIRQYSPEVVITWDYWALFEFHPDHRAVAQAAMEALSFSHFPLFHPEHMTEGLKPHLVVDRYYFAKDSRLCDTVVDISEFMDKKIASLLAHDSQMKLTVDELVLNLQGLGATEAMLKKIDRNNCRPLVELMTKAFAEQIGKKAGYLYGEEFRFERAGGDIAKAAFQMLK
jgi:LmbE family N-acetylglucosaminyl deacetylase